MRCGVGFHLCRHLGRLRLRRLRHRHIRAKDRRLARLAHGACGLRARRARAGLVRTSSPSRGLVHHSDRGVQYVSIKYTERLKDAGVEPSVGSVGDSYDNALAETINGLYKAEVIWRRGRGATSRRRVRHAQWSTVQQQETAEPIETFRRRSQARYYAQTRHAMRRTNRNGLRQSRRSS